MGYLLKDRIHSSGEFVAAVQRVAEVSLRAVEKYVTAIFEKLGMAAGAEGHRRVLAVLKYLNA